MSIAVLADPLELEINEASTALYTVTLKDETGTVITAADISSILMTQIDTASGDVINSRTAQNVKNANNCTIHATSGLFSWEIQAADTVINGSSIAAGSFEEHLVTITVVWATTKKAHREIKLKVKNLRSV